MRNPAAGFINRIRTPHTEADEAKEKPKPLKPHEWRGQRTGAARWARRIQRRRQAATNRRFQRARVTQLREVVRDRERRAVAVLAEVESRAGVAPGGLRAQLLEEGKLSASFAADHKNAGNRQVAHTPVEILAAFGINDEAIVELYEHLVETKTYDAELRRAQKRQAAQVKREGSLAVLEASNEAGGVA